MFQTRNASSSDRFAGIKIWINYPIQAKDVLMFYFDDQEDLYNWTKVYLIMNDIQNYFGDIVFTPPLKQQYFPNEWPSPAQLVTMGKRIIFTSRTDYGEQMVPLIFYSDSVWSEWGLYDLNIYPTCTLGSQSYPLNNGQLTRILEDSLIFGPFYNGTTGGLFMPNNITYYTQCNINILSTDQLSPTLAEGYIWTWDTTEPKQLFTNISMGSECASLKLNGRWQTQNCSTIQPAACVNVSNIFDWILSTTSSTWNTVTCPKGYTFGVPTTGYQNQLLWGKISNNDAVWIKYQYTSL